MSGVESVGSGLGLGDGDGAVSSGVIAGVFVTPKTSLFEFFPKINMERRYVADIAAKRISVLFFIRQILTLSGR